MLEVCSCPSVVVMKDAIGEASLSSPKEGVYFYLAHQVESKTLKWVLKQGVARSRLLTKNATLREKALSD